MRRRPQKLALLFGASFVTCWTLGCGPADAAPSPPKATQTSTRVELNTEDAERTPSGRLDSASGMSATINQWPQDAKEQSQAIQERLKRVSTKINEVCRTDYSVILSETGRGGASTGKGIVYVDFSLVWRVSEDALASLIAHEFAHEALSHSQDLALLDRPNNSTPSRIQQLRELERRADEFAGRVLAATDYDPSGFDQLLSISRDTEWSNPQLRAYYPNRKRIKTLMDSYESRRRDLGNKSVARTP